MFVYTPRFSFSPSKFHRGIKLADDRSVVCYGPSSKADPDPRDGGDGDRGGGVQLAPTDISLFQNVMKLSKNWGGRIPRYKYPLLNIY